jgi:hypothetical protein
MEALGRRRSSLLVFAVMSVFSLVRPAQQPYGSTAESYSRSLLLGRRPETIDYPPSDIPGTIAAKEPLVAMPTHGGECPRISAA